MEFDNFSVIEIKPKIFHFHFKDYWKLAISFFRYQEEFESQLSKVRNKSLDFVDLLEIYSKKYGNGDFTYCTDYAGFNVPSYIFEQVLENNYIDFHKYDYDMIKAYKYCKSICNSKFYIIGSVNKSYFLHELAHGLYYTNEEYRQQMLNLINSLDKTKVKKFFKILKDENYHKSVFEDEMQAYLSTGLLDSMCGIFDKSIEKKFRATFNRYYK